MVSWIAGHPEIRRLIGATIWIAVLALMARRYQTKRHTAIQMAVWALLVLSGVVLVKLLN